jgi:hypothetical protein
MDIFSMRSFSAEWLGSTGIDRNISSSDRFQDAERVSGGVI